MATRRRNSSSNKADTAMDTALPSPEPKTLVLATTGGSGHLGVDLTSLTDIGVEITKTDDADLCFKAGLRTGMVIVAVGGTAVTEHEACLEALDKAKSSGTEVEVTYLTPEHVASIKEEARLKYEKKWGWFNWKVKSLLALIVIGLLVLHPPPSVTSAMQKYDEMLNLKKEPEQMHPGSGPPLEPLSDFERELKITELIELATLIGEENPVLRDMAGKLKARYADGSKTDPRDELAMMKGMREEMVAMRGMGQAHAVQDPDDP